MKKFFMAAIGISLFVAGYFQTRRQAQYAAKATPADPTYATTPAAAQNNVKSPFAFWLTKS